MVTWVQYFIHRPVENLIYALNYVSFWRKQKSNYYNDDQFPAWDHIPSGQMDTLPSGHLSRGKTHENIPFNFSIRMLYILNFSITIWHLSKSYFTCISYQLFGLVNHYITISQVYFYKTVLLGWFVLDNKNMFMNFLIQQLLKDIIVNH